jgi:DNA end-binding protein Ku
VKGYEYEKGKFVVLKDEDFARVDLEAAQTVDIVNFVELREINPVLFFKPYYLSPEKGGDKPYALLRDALENSGKVGIAKLIIKARQHLAAIKPQTGGLVLELMHFPEEILSPTEIKWPAGKTASPAEIQMAKQLVNTMSGKWKPELYQDEYHAALKKIIEDKIEHGEKKPAQPARTKRPQNVVDLVSVLQESIKATQGRLAAPSARRKPKKKAA